MYRARCMRDKCMDARMRCIRYANLKNALVYHHKQVNKRKERREVGSHAHTHTHLLHHCPHSEGPNKYYSPNDKQINYYRISNLLIERMQKKEEDGRSLCLGIRKWCMLETRLVLKSRTTSLPPQFVLSFVSENSQSPRTGSLHAAEYPRPREITTGSAQYPPAAFGSIGCKKIAGRHWILPVGRNFLQKTVLTANRGQTVWHGISGICKHGHASYHASQGSMALDPRAINGAW